MSSESHESPLLLGLTGGIGSGKSTVAKIFSSLGVPVFSADEAGRSAYDHPPIQGMVVDLLGPQILNAESKPDRSKIAALVFKDATKLEALNNIIHPFVKSLFLQWLTHHKKNTRYVVRESAILFESKLASDHHLLVHVSAPVELRISRVMDRDHCSRESVLNRMSKQWSDALKEPSCDFVIQNDDLHPLLPQVLHIHQMMTDARS